LRSLASDSRDRAVELVNGPPRADAFILRTDRLYDPGRLKRGLKRGKSPETAVVWRLDRPESLATAGDELTRRLSYQPLGKYWAFPLAERLAERLCPTRVRPNLLTLASGMLMVTAAALVAAGPSGWSGRIAVSIFLALALVLDTADGRLARLQGTRSDLGRWLDEVLDELADMALHGAVAWSAFCRAGEPIWLVLGIFFASGKYLFLIQSLSGDRLEESRDPERASILTPGRDARPGRSPTASQRVAGLVRLAGHADVRWHLWIVLALFGRLDLALVAYAVYFPARAVLGAVRKVVRHG
jgi:phosphatidylglycerophosphate synthase